MTARCAVLLLAPAGGAAPPGLDPVALRSAMAEDVADLLAGLAGVDPAVAATSVDLALVAAVAWPGTRVFEVPLATVAAALAAAMTAGYHEAALVAADAPDLPAMHVGKLFRALGSSAVAVAPADGGGAVCLAARLPAPDWLLTTSATTGAAASLDDVDLVALRRSAGSGQVAGTPGWHRLRRPADIARLDPGLEGWDATRALLSR